MKKYLKIAFLVALIVGTVLIIRENSRKTYQRDEGKIFGTFYHITYQSGENLHDEILAELQRVDRSLSMFNDSSTISRINRNEAVDLSVDSLFVEVYELAQRIADDTNGAFDITVAPLVNAWGFGFKNEQMPSEAAVDSLRSFVGYKKVSLAGEKNQFKNPSDKQFKNQPSTFKILKEDPRTMLDCSAIAKGFGCDLVGRLFQRKGIENYMIEIGGEVVVGGVSEKGEKWRIGVTKPENAAPSQPPPTGGGETLQTILQLPLSSPHSGGQRGAHSSLLAPRSSFSALATSGNYRNFYVKDGKRYAHTIDPRTGHPVQHSILSATVIADNCATADAYATAFMVLGLDDAQRILDRHPDLLAYLIYTDENGNYAIWHSPELTP